MSSTTPSTEVVLHPTTSPVLMALEPAARPTEPVACMTCPMGIWQVNGKTLQCYCRMLFRYTWETDKPGKIKQCDAPIMLKLQAEKDE